MNEFVYKSSVVATGVCSGLIMFGLIIFVVYKIFLAPTEEVNTNKEEQKTTEEKLNDIDELDGLEDMDDAVNM